MLSNADLLPPDAAEHLRQFRHAVEKALPGQVAEMRLFGSRVRGDAEADSDYDVAVFVHDLGDRADVQTILSDAAYPHDLEGFFIHPIGLPADYLREIDGYRPELADEIAREGVVLA